MLRTKNKYLRLLANSLNFIALIFLIDLVVGNFLRHYYFKSNFGTNYYLTYALDSTRADVIIIGSGRARSHYVPEIIEDNLDLTCFNTGMDGNYLPNSYAVYKSIKKRYTPQFVLLDIRHLNELFKGSGGYNQLGSLLPYYKEKEEIRDIITLRGKYERLKLISRIYPFNSELLTIIQGSLKKEDITEFKGYLPRFGSLSDITLSTKQAEDYEIDTNKIRILESIASDCNSHDITLIIILSPMYTLTEQKAGVSLLNDLAIKYGAEFWNYFNDTIFLKPEYFKDAEHMNDLGAKKFTKLIAYRLQQMLNH